jgi:hypothetical protein
MSATAAQTASSDIYAAHWAEYRRLRRDIFFVWIFYVPCVGLIAWLGDHFFHTFVPGFLSAGAWAIWFLITNGRFSQFSCPRCGDAFEGGPGPWRLRLWIFARKCQHCGLKKFASSQGATAEC